jgi:hypothetical protein
MPSGPFFVDSTDEEVNIQMSILWTNFTQVFMRFDPSFNGFVLDVQRI